MAPGYACPVCEAPQRDAVHLANHMAFTAMLRHEGHEAWLDERVPAWSECDPETLGERVGEFAPETEYEEVFEDTVGQSGSGRGDLLGGHDHGHGHQYGQGRSSGGTLDAEAQSILDEARELTRQMRPEGADAEDRDGDEADASADGTGNDRVGTGERDG